MNSLTVHNALNDLGFRIPSYREKEPAYAYEHKIADEVFLYVKKKDNRIFDKNYLLIHPSNIKNKEKLESIKGLTVSWTPRKSTSYREFPKFENNKSPYGFEVTIENMDALSALINVINLSSFKQKRPQNKKAESSMATSSPLNQIIYGPPGTGKTYSTTEEAVRISEPAWYAETKTTITSRQQFRDALKEKYDALVEQVSTSPKLRQT